MCDRRKQPQDDWDYIAELNGSPVPDSDDQVIDHPRTERNTDSEPGFDYTLFRIFAWNLN